MKRVFSTDDPPHKSGTVSEASTSKLKYQNLLQDFLDLQKEFVSKKRKLEAMKLKKETLVAELGFLSRRRKYLMKLQHPKGEFNDNEHILENYSKVLERKQNLGGVKVAEKFQNCLRGNKMIGKKKISWKIKSLKA